MILYGESMLAKGKFEECIEALYIIFDIFKGVMMLTHWLKMGSGMS